MRVVSAESTPLSSLPPPYHSFYPRESRCPFRHLFALVKARVHPVGDATTPECAYLYWGNVQFYGSFRGALCWPCRDCLDSTKKFRPDDAVESRRAARFPLTVFALRTRTRNVAFGEIKKQLVPRYYPSVPRFLAPSFYPRVHRFDDGI